MTRPQQRIVPGALLLCGLVVSGAATAGLGEPRESVQRDHVAMHGDTFSVTPMGAYDVHESVTADGTHVRQYVAPSGTVFAVAWSGRSLPDLKVLLAQHYGEYVAEAAAHRGSHHVLSIATPTLVLNITKLTRASTGNAHVPALLPANTSAQELR